MTINNQPMPVVVQGGPFLPVPRIARNSNPSAALVAGVVGDALARPLVELEAAVAVAEAAVAELEACRPGSATSMDGVQWLAAFAADADAAASGVQPKTWKVAALLADEPHRWARAQAFAGAVAQILRRTGQELDRKRIASSATTVAEAKATVFADAAKKGWRGRADKAAAWQQVRAGEVALEAFTAARQVQEWATGTVQPPSTDVKVPHVRHLPEDPTARGHWLALDLYLDGDTTWLHLPDGVLFPEGSDELVSRAMVESGDRFVGLRERGHFAMKR